MVRVTPHTLNASLIAILLVILCLSSARKSLNFGSPNDLNHFPILLGSTSPSFIFSLSFQYAATNLTVAAFTSSRRHRLLRLTHFGGFHSPSNSIALSREPTRWSAELQIGRGPRLPCDASTGIE